MGLIDGLISPISSDVGVGGAGGSTDWADITSTPTTLVGYGITDAQPLDADLTAIAALTTTGVLRRTAADTWSFLTVGTAANNLVQLDASARLPAVDGSLLTNLPSSAGEAVTSLGTFSTTTSQALSFTNPAYTAIIATGANVTFTFSNAPTTGTKREIDFIFRYTAGAFNFPATVSWSGMATAGSSYVFETGKDYIVTFMALGGTNIAAIAAPFPGAIF